MPGHRARQLLLHCFAVLTINMSKPTAQDLHIWSQRPRAVMPACAHKSHSTVASFHVPWCMDSQSPNPEDPARSWHSAGVHRQHAPQASISFHGPFPHYIHLWVSATKAPCNGHPVPVPSQDTHCHSHSRSHLMYNATEKL